jgi:ParB family chromosome partitioning protein
MAKFIESGKTRNCVKMSVSIIDPDPDQPREDSGFDEESIEQLGNNMVLTGQLHPVVVRRSPVSADRWMIVSGERRYRAAILKGLDAIDVVQLNIDTKMSKEDQEKEVMFAALAGNFSVSLSDSELSKYFVKMISKGCTVPEIANRTGYKESFIRSLCAIDKASEPIRDAVKNRTMSRTAAATATTAPEPARKRIEEKAAKGERVKVKDVQVETYGRASMIPATKIDALISVCVHNCKNTEGQQSVEWDSIAMFLRNHVLGSVEVERIGN